MYRVLSPGGPIFNGVSSNVFPFGFFVCFGAANNGTDELVDPQPPQNGCTVNYKDVTYFDMWLHEQKKNSREKKRWLALHHVTKWAYLSSWREIHIEKRKGGENDESRIINGKSFWTIARLNIN